MIWEKLKRVKMTLCLNSKQCNQLTSLSIYGVGLQGDQIDLEGERDKNNCFVENELLR